MEKQYKSIEFDINSDALRELGIDRGKAYREVRVSLLENGFAHRQKSVYNSLYKMSESDVADLIEKMTNEIVWAVAAFDKLDVANITDQHELISFLHLSYKIDDAVWEEGHDIETLDLIKDRPALIEKVKDHMERERERKEEERRIRREQKIKQEHKHKE